MMTEPFVCHHCGEAHRLSELRDFSGELYCPECLEALTDVCDCCGQRSMRYELHQEQDLTLC